MSVRDPYATDVVHSVVPVALDRVCSRLRFFYRALILHNFMALLEDIGASWYL